MPKTSVGTSLVRPRLSQATSIVPIGTPAPRPRQRIAPGPPDPRLVPGLIPSCRALDPLGVLQLADQLEPVPEPERRRHDDDRDHQSR